VSNDEIIGFHQLRAAHQRYHQGLLAGKKTIDSKGHTHGVVEMRYVKLEGIWKVKGISWDVRWNEGHFEKVFRLEGWQHHAGI